MTRHRTYPALLGLAAFLTLLIISITPANAAFGKLKDERWTIHAAEAGITVDHKPWAAILDAYLHEGGAGVHLFDYAGVSQADKEKLDNYVAYLQSLPVSALTRDQQFAYWVNLYNAFTVKLVIEAYPVNSIMDVRSSGLFNPGPWKRKLMSVEGQRLSLDNVEHNILRPIWRDPRIHYAVNCASIGCPDLALRPFTADRLDEMLDEAARSYINHPRGIRIESGGEITASKIYSWYKEDFGDTEAGIIAHALPYSDEEKAAQLSGRQDIDDFEYDWSLNDWTNSARDGESSE